MTKAEMEARIKALEKQFILLDDINQVKRLQRAYSYYVTRMMKDEIVDCFADHPETALYWLEGAYLGKDAVKRYFNVGTDSPPQPPEFFHQVMPLAGVVDIDPKGERAQGRWYTFGPHSLPIGEGKFKKSFVGGVYEIEYIKENGVWKFLKVNWQIPYRVAIREEDWKTPEMLGETIGHPRGTSKTPVADIPYDPEDPRFMTGYVIPFHFKHPVTGKKTSEDSRNNKNVIQNVKAQKKAQKPSSKKNSK